MSAARRVVAGLAAAQLALAARSGTAEFFVMSAVAWAGALLLASERVVTLEWSRARAPALLAGAASLALLTRAYGPAHRLAPLLGGSGVAVAFAGWRGLAPLRRPLAVLALPLLNPPPLLLRRFVDPSPLTATAAAGLLRASGIPVSQSGALLDLPRSTLEVATLCSGLNHIFQMVALAALAVALFPTTRRQKVWLVASGASLGFFVNAVRIALLAKVADAGAMDLFAELHEGPLAPLFSLAASLLSVAVWSVTLGKAPVARDLEPLA